MLSAPLTLLLTAACTPQPDVVIGTPAGELSPEAARLLKGKVAGASVPCISRFEAERSERLPNGAIAFDPRARVTYIQDFGGSCAAASDRSTYMVRQSTLSQLCRGDIVQLVDNTGNFNFGSCVYADFVPYRTPGR